MRGQSGRGLSPCDAPEGETTGMGARPWEPYLRGHQAGCVVWGGVLDHCLFLGWLLHHFRIW